VNLSEQKKAKKCACLSFIGIIVVRWCEFIIHKVYTFPL